MTVKGRFPRSVALNSEENRKLEAVLKTGIKFTDLVKRAINSAYEKVSKERGDR